MEPRPPFQDEELNELWNRTAQEDTLYQTVLSSIQSGARSFPSEVKLKIQVGDCSVDTDGRLRHRGKLWVPGAPVSAEADYNTKEPVARQNDVLRTKLIQSVHDSPVYGHPGRDSTTFILGRNFY